MKLLIIRLSIYSIILFFFSCTKGGSGEFASGGGTSFESGRGSAPGGGSGGGGTGTGTPGVITAGEWNDIDNWTFWYNLLQKDTIKTFPGIWGFYTQNKITVILKDNNGKLVHDAKLTITNGGSSFAGVTDNSGKAELFAGLNTSSYHAASFNLKAEYKGQSFDLGTITISQGVISKSISVSKSLTNVVDIMFVVDATGSMGDELTYLKTEIKDVITRSGAALPGMQIRMGSVFYRDHGDDYVTRPFNFTTDVNKLSAFINNQSAGGGGDFPEAVDEALEAAINNQQWSNAAVNRLLFLILDAPPHKAAANISRLKNVVAAAQQKGIRIIPVSASGIDWETEFLLRFMSVSTNSTYAFITNHSGIGNPHHTPTVGSYQVEFLNNLMVRLITKYGKNID